MGLKNTSMGLILAHRSFLIFSINKSIRSIVSYNTAFEIWSSLERTYASTRRFRIIELRTELQNIRKDGLSADEYIFKLNSIIDKLASIGEPITHNDQIIYLLHGLGLEYNSFADTINARTDQPNIEEIHCLLLSSDMRHQRQNSVDQLNFPQPNLVNLNAQAHVANYQAYKKSQPQRTYSNFPQNSFSKPVNHSSQNSFSRPVNQFPQNTKPHFSFNPNQPGILDKPHFPIAQNK
ncbi:hypothetical protein TIFTF001_036919 [Ficus carica]|uniref:Retrovirus-related Pol polyprotein from transposon TNT 1-94 n=1 Tax=Ficus carica TaxID=3494 RepID=A0AA88E7S2_FICCA|nr:hypothetical protein TIFTF001_036916 [Ficus carica]GMN67862.1 hypothetical protein TIFTF001_036919 [Ficus carica]